MKCILCGQRKGKRHCPAKNGLICPQCCGEKRMVEIECPPDCKYLSSGQRHANRRMASQFGRGLSQARLRKFIEDLERLGPIVMFLERALVKFARGLSKLDEKTLLEGIALAKETMSTEAKGVIYQHRSTNPLVEQISLALTKEIDYLRSSEAKEELGLPPLGAEDCASALECLEIQIEDHRHSHESGAYLTYMRRNHPDAAASQEDDDSDTPPLIIQP
ncbi:MAG TPA: hypothetical protein VLV83_27045 [Acidobacteriota bacterium]|nr:hypothetical protein [Acidobacteriota bacterium]